MMFGTFVFPAAATDNFTVSVSEVTGAANGTVKLDLSIANNPGLKALSVRVYYKKSLVTCSAVSIKKTADGGSTIWADFYDVDESALGSSKAEDTANLSTARKNDGWSMAAFSIATDYEGGLTEAGIIGSLTFKIAEDVESCDAVLEVEIVKASDANSADITESTAVNGKIAINGVTPTINTVALAANTVNVVGGTAAAQTVQASAASAKGTNITGNVAWSVSPAGKGVTINDAGLISVDAKAAAGSYTVSAAAITDKSQGDTKTAVLTVTRAAAALSKIQLTNEADVVLVPADGTEVANKMTVSAALTDQFGDAIQGKTITWTVKDADEQAVTGITISELGVVNVANTAKAAVTDTTGKVMTVTAACEGQTATATFTVKRDASAVSSVAITGADSAAVPAKADSPKTETYTAKVYDQYGKEMSGQSVTWSVGTIAGVSVTDGTLSVTNEAAAGSVTITAACGSVSGTKDVTITKAAAVAATIEITGSAESVEVPVTGNATASYTAKVYDQYGAEMTDAAVTWTITTTEGISIANGVVTVTADAKTAITNTTGTSLTVTATCGSATDTESITVKRAASVATTVTVSGGSASVEVPAGSTAAQSEAFAAEVKDQYGTVMTGTAVVWTITATEGVSIANGVVAVSADAKTAIADTTGTSLTVTATCGDASNTASITVKRAASAGTTIRLYKGEVEFTGTTDVAIVPVSGTNTYAYGAKLFDQYGAEMQALTLAFDAGDSGASFADGMLSVSSAAVKDKTCVLTASYTGLTAKTITITLKDIEITAPTVTPVATVFGSTWAEIIPASAISGGSAKLNGVTVEGSFYLKNAVAEIPAVGSNSYQVFFKSNDQQYDVLACEGNVTITAKPLTDADISIAAVADVTYNGSAYTPDVTVKMGNTTLTASDYETAYSSNVNVGTAVVTITGKGNYTGTTTVNFTIKPVKLTVTAGSYTVTKTYDTTTAAGAAAGTLALDGVLTGDMASVAVTGTAGAYASANVGTGINVTVTPSLSGTAAGNYTVPETVTLAVGTINKADVTAADLTYTIPTDAVYSGAAQALTVSKKTTGIGALTVKYAGNTAAPVNAGTYAVTVEVAASANYNAATLSLGNYSIAKKNLEDVSIYMTPDKTYTGEAIAPTPVVSFGDVTLAAGTDFTYSYANNVNAGTATITITAVAGSNYTGSKDAAFNILKKDVVAADYSFAIPNGITYDKAEHAATAEKVTAGIGALTLKYNGETAVPLKAGTYAVTLDIAESDNYNASANIALGTLEIGKKEVTITFGEDELVYNNTEKALTAEVGALCSGDVVTAVLEGAKNTEIGTYSATVTGLTGADAANYKLPETGLTCDYTIAHSLTNVTLAPADSLSCKIDGLTLIVNGYVKKVGEEPAESIVISSDSITESLTVTEAMLAEGGSITTTAGVAYTVDTSAVVVNTTDIDLAVEDPAVNVAQGLDQAAQDALEEVAAAEIEVEGLTNSDLLSNIFAEAEGMEEVADVEIKMDIQLEDFTTEGGVAVLTIDLTPQITFMDANGDPVGEENQTISNEWITEPITISIQLPAVMSWDNVYAKHYLNAEKTRYEIIPVTVDPVTGVATWQQTSFSPVELMNDSRSASITFQFDNETEETVSYKPSDVNTVFPTDSRSGYSFDGWKIGEETYTALTDELLTAINGTTAEAAPVFSSNYVPSSPVETKYTIKAEAGENGTISPDGNSSVTKGSSKTYTITANDGYVIADVLVDGESVGAVSTYTFESVKANHTISASFKAAKKTYVNPFGDVKESDYFYKPVLWAAEKNITNGVYDVMFEPNSNCTRAQVVTFLWRAAGKPEVTDVTNPFTDVDESSYYYKAVLWAVKNNITTGVTATEFRPNDYVNRGQTVTFLYRMAEKPTVNGTNPFVDVKADDYYYDAVVWAVENEITNGMSATQFVPSAICTRGQIVTFLYRYMGEEDEA